MSSLDERTSDPYPVYMAPPRLISLPAESAEETERLVAEIWREVLELERVGVDQNFFDLGGHSLLLVQVHGRLRKAFSKPISMLDLFQHPTAVGVTRSPSAPVRLFEPKERKP